MADFKKLAYNEFVERFNTLAEDNNLSVRFDGGYEFINYNGIPYVIDQTSLNEFDFERTEVVPISEEYNQETPSVNASDRSDYICQYQLMFRLQQLDEVKQVMNLFRDYYFTNKQFTLDGYKVGVKTVRGNKQSSMMVESGNIYARYKIDVYMTATKYGYIVKDTDIWKMRKKNEITNAGSFVLLQDYEILTLGDTDWNTVAGTTGVTYQVGDEINAKDVGSGTGTAQDAYKTLKLIEDRSATQGNPAFSNADSNGVGKGRNTLKTSSTSFRIAYESDYFTKHLFSVAMNKENIEQIYELSHTFDGTTFSYVVQISSLSRALAIGGTVILDLDWFEFDA